MYITYTCIPSPKLTRLPQSSYFHTNSSAIQGPVSSWVVAWISWLFLHLCFLYIVLTFTFCPFTQQLPRLLFPGGVTNIREDVECWGELCFAHVSSFAMLSSLLSQILAGNLAVQTIGSRRDPKITAFFIPELDTRTNCYIWKKKAPVSGDGEFVLYFWQVVAFL